MKTKLTPKRVLFVLMALLIVIPLAILAMKKKQTTEPQHYYLVDTRTRGPKYVKGRIDDGWKILGRNKMWNPQPHPLTDADIDTIRMKLPGWLKENYPEVELDTFALGGTQLKNKIKYEFTLLNSGKTATGDFYVMKLGKDGVQRNVYIEKGNVYDFELNMGVPTLIYPFYNDEWHEDYSDTRPFHPDDFW